MIRKLLAMICLFVFLVTVVGCSYSEIPNKTTTIPTTLTTATPTTTAPFSVQFPLEEEVTLTLTVPVSPIVSDGLLLHLSGNQLWNDLYERTNVKVEISPLPYNDRLSYFQSMLETDKYGDIIVTSWLHNNEDISAITESGKFLPLNDYITNPNIMPNFNSRVLDESPEAKGIFTSPDGHIYILGSYDGDKSNYLENTCWVNKTWVEDASMTIEDLATLDGLEKFFDWVEKNDANGNGDTTDELPFSCYMWSGNSIETLLGMWGIPTKDQTNEGYCFLENGQVKFAPLTQNWIDFMTTMKKWFDNGWAYEDYLLGHDGDGKPLYEYRQDQYVRDNGEPERIAFWTGTGAPARNRGTKLPGVEMCEYVSILPPKVEGYKTRWYVHPGEMGLKGNFAISANCENPEIALAWMDQFYSQEVNERVNFGEPGNQLRIDEDGKVGTGSMGGDTTLSYLYSDANRLNMILSGLPSAVTQDEWLNRRITTDTLEKRRELFALYEDVVNTEVWPRPYMTSSVINEHAALYAEISQIIAKYRNDWLSGKGDPSTDRDQFEAELKAAGVDRMVALMQEAYDVFRNAME